MATTTSRTDDEPNRAPAELLRAEAGGLADDLEDRAEARQVLADLEPLRAW
jgi:hypothetical protein